MVMMMMHIRISDCRPRVFCSLPASSSDSGDRVRSCSRPLDDAESTDRRRWNEEECVRRKCEPVVPVGVHRVFWARICDWLVTRVAPVVFEKWPTAANDLRTCREEFFVFHAGVESVAQNRRSARRRKDWSYCYCYDYCWMLFRFLRSRRRRR